MEAHTKRFGVIGGFTLMIILLAVNAIATRRQLADQVDSRNWVAHSRQVLLELTQTKLLIREAESGQRGYLYTDDSKYLAPYRASISVIQPHIDKLARLTAGDSGQRARVATLRMLTAEKLAELSRTISLFQSGQKDAARALVLSDAGFRLMDQLRGVIDAMIASEVSLEDAESAAYQRGIHKTVASIYLASAIGALGIVLLAFFILREMELRQRHANQLLIREEWFRVTLTSLGDAVIATDRNGKVTYLNPLAEQLIGIKIHDAVGRAIKDVFPIFNEITGAPVENPIAKVMQLGQIVGLANHTVLRSANGSMVPIEDSAAPIRDRGDALIGVVLVFRDATRERRMQEMIRETEKLATAARMSATVAHEINNPLEAIGNLIYLAKISPNASPAIVRHLDLAEEELERVSHVAKRTLGFYRESRMPENLDIAAIVEYVLKVLANKLETKNITVERQFAACPPVVGLSGELVQVISNLIANAADAVNQNGKIWIGLSCVRDGRNSIVRMEIEDDGPGIPPEHAKRIFEPFYTTKKDVGTGLGLWVSRGIIERHGGTIDLHPHRDHQSRGAAFKICLPAAPQAMPSATANATTQPPAAPAGV